MKMMIDARLKTLIAETLDIPSVEVAPETGRGELPTWDSLSHLRLMMAVEAEFDTKFTMDEIMDIHTARQLQQAIDAHLRG